MNRFEKVKKWLVEVGSEIFTPMRMPASIEDFEHYLSLYCEKKETAAVISMKEFCESDLMKTLDEKIVKEGIDFFSLVGRIFFTKLKKEKEKEEEEKQFCGCGS